MGKTKNPDFDAIIQKAVNAGRMQGMSVAKDAYKATERRLYAIPVLKLKVKEDREKLEEIKTYGAPQRSKSIVRFSRTGIRLTQEEILEALVMDMEATIAADTYEIECVEKALTAIEADTYYETVKGKYIDGRSDEQIQEQYKTDATKLSADELLYAATLEDNAAKQEDIYKTAAKYYDKDYRAYNNLAVLAFNRGDEAKAKEYIRQALSKNANAPEANANLGLIALKNGNIQEAEAYIAKAAEANGINQALGNLSIAKGNYAQAEQYFKDSYNNSAALAQILNKNYAAAKATLNNIKNADGLTSYLHAITSARQGNKYATQSYLKEALQKDSSLSNYAAEDLEFANMK